MHRDQYGKFDQFFFWQVEYRKAKMQTSSVAFSLGSS